MRNAKVDGTKNRLLHAISMALETVLYAFGVTPDRNGTSVRIWDLEGNVDALHVLQKHDLRPEGFDNSNVVPEKLIARISAVPPPRKREALTRRASRDKLNRPLQLHYLFTMFLEELPN